MLHNAAMERFDVINGITEEALAAAVSALRAGRVVLYPTDTQYALGVDAFSNNAVDRLYVLKGRESNKPTHAMVAGVGMAKRYVIWNDTAEKIAAKFLPGPFTIILPKRGEFMTGIAREIGTFGVRIPADEVSRALARAFDGAITATSANRSGMMPQSSVGAIVGQLGDAAKDIFVLDAGILPARAPSTVVEIRDGKLTLLREGPIPFGDLQALV